jgi:predicted Zn finger-like uncharacterized protein
MILTCPSCGTQYVVKDGAIPPGGRQVRCASCKHSWHEDPESAEIRPPEPQAEPVAGPEPVDASERVVASEPDSPPDGETESVAEASLIEPRSGPEAEERAYEEASIESEHDGALGEPADYPPPDALTGGKAFETPPAPASRPSSTTYANAPFDITKPQGAPTARQEDWQEPPIAEAQDDEFTPYQAADEVQPRRRSPLVAVLVIVILVVAAAAAFWFLAPPDLKARLGLGAAGTSPLALVTTHMDRQRLESGNELLTVTGRVINPTPKEQDVPPLQAQLKTRGGRVVYSWTIAPPARSLAPGASASFNSAEVNVPPGGDELTITLGGGEAG